MYDIILAFITAFFMTFYAIPSIIKIAKIKRLYTEPNARSSHTQNIPSLGGIGIFAGVLFSVTFWTPFAVFSDLQYILCAFIIMFLVGAKDDIDPMSPPKKLVGQVIASTILVYQADVRITSFFGLFGIEGLPQWFSIVFSVVTIVFIINAFNLIDGIDGLAGTIGCIVSATFGTWFFLIERLELAIVAFALAGAIIAFLRYNLTPSQIFMGDTGSLIIGLVAAMLAIKFIDINKDLSGIYRVPSAPSVAIGVLIVPVVDTIRVFTMRILKGGSPFKPDKTHIHHLLLRLGLSHTRSTTLLGIANLVFIATAWLFRQLGSLASLLTLMGAAFILTGLLYYLVRLKDAQTPSLSH